VPSDAVTSSIDDAQLDSLLRRYRTNHDRLVRDEIVEATSWLALRSARRFADRGEPFDDLLQVARIGLLKAIERFDPERGLPFGAFATPTIIGELRRHFRDYTWSVHVGRGSKDLRPAVNAMVDELFTALGRSPRVSEVAERLGLAEETVIEVLEANNAYRTRELDSSGITHSSDDAGDFEQVLDRHRLSHLMNRLDERERTIVYLRFFEELSQSQIAERIGTSQVHVSRLLAAALAKLREPARAGGPRDSAEPESTTAV
jgi:RNA polymerase sigma-B factor